MFKKWLSEEREYLQGLKTEPVVETLEMEYCQRLLTLQASKYVNCFMLNITNNVH